MLRDVDVRRGDEKSATRGMEQNETAEPTAARDCYDRVYHAKAVPTAIFSKHLGRIAFRTGPWEGRPVLDVGCGAGDWLKTVTALGAAPTGVGISPVAVDVCR